MLPCTHPSLPLLQHKSCLDAACSHIPVESAAVAVGTAVVILQAHQLPAISCRIVGLEGVSWVLKRIFMEESLCHVSV